MTHWDRAGWHRVAFAAFGSADSGRSDSGGGDSGGADSGSADSGAAAASAAGPDNAAPGAPTGLSPYAIKKPKPDLHPEVPPEVRGEFWPPDAFQPKDGSHITGKKFSPASWNDYYAAIVVLGEFVRLHTAPEPKKAGDPDGWNTLNIGAPAAGDDLTQEMATLTAYMEFRPSLAAEALAQRSALVRYWQAMLFFNAASHPATTRMMEVCLRIAQFAAMHYKNKTNRPRPSQLSPWLLPSFAVPAHASFPSGHATEAHLQALCLTAIMCNQTITQAVSSPKPATSTVYSDVDLPSITCLAKRIARNREVMGLHYPSDSAAGEELAKGLFAMMGNCTTIDKLMSDAAAEWK